MAELRNIADKRVGFEQIYRDYSKPMFLYALSFLTSEEEAEDVIQEVFVNFWKDETYRKVKGEVTKTYLFRSVKNNCLNRLKKKDVLRDRLDLLYGYRTSQDWRCAANEFRLQHRSNRLSEAKG